MLVYENDSYLPELHSEYPNASRSDTQFCEHSEKELLMAKTYKEKARVRNARYAKKRGIRKGSPAYFKSVNGTINRAKKRAYKRGRK
jgi:hypothetical protein